MLNNFIRGVATQIAVSALRNVSNKLPGVNLSYNTGNGSGGANTHDFASLEPMAESKNYTFPLDVESGPGLGNQGHYMMFYINKQTKATLDFGGKSGFSGGGGIKIDIDIPDFIKMQNANGTFSNSANTTGIQTQANADQPLYSNLYTDKILRDAGIDSLTNWYIKNRSTVAVKRAPTKRLDTAIAMYMPASVTTGYGANYTDTEIGLLTEQAINTYDQFSSGNFQGGMDEIKAIAPEIADAIGQLMLNTAGALPGLSGLKEAAEMKSGVIISDRMELAFKGIDKRKFEYTFKMIPKSQREAEEIRNIIFAFKSAMMPEFFGGNLSGRKLIVPNTFDIEYMWNGAENQFINKISECVLTNMNVSYGGDSYKTHEGIDGDGAPPIETTISLSFSELELITREKIHEGF